MTAFARHDGRGVIIISFVLALLLTIFPLPEWAVSLRPEWVALVLIYWVLALPHRVGVGYAWVVGLFLDVLRGAILGQHALALTVIAYLALKLHQRIRVYPLWQQSLSILILVTLFQLLVLWINGIIGKPTSSWAYWIPALTSMLIWPAVYLILRHVRRDLGVS